MSFALKLENNDGNIDNGDNELENVYNDEISRGSEPRRISDPNDPTLLDIMDMLSEEEGEDTSSEEEV